MAQTSNVLIEKINQLKEKNRAIILAHNYQLAEVQDIADHVGDSLDLSRKAAAAKAELIVFCGVHFMAETAAILSPEKTVLLPSLEAGCPMAMMIDAQSLEKLKAQHPQARVVCYVNSTAEVKALSDICCTSANAAQVIAQIPEGEEIIFVPDKYLGHYVASKTGRNLILWPGYCPTHLRILPEHLERRRCEFPEAKIIAHPESHSEVCRLADAVLSTNGMCQYVRESDAHTFIVGTEVGIIHRLQKENPHKQFIAASEQALCPNMKMITLEKVLWALEEMRFHIQVPEETSRRARRAVERMIATA